MIVGVIMKKLVSEKGIRGFHQISSEILLPFVLVP
jgi:hypothetical protein